MRFRSNAAGLIAGAVMIFLVPAARADFTVTLSDASNNSTYVTTSNSPTLSNDVTLGLGTTFDGLKFSITANQSIVGGVDSVNFAAIVTGKATAEITYTVTGTFATGGNVVSSSLGATNNFSGTFTADTSPGGAPTFLSTTVPTTGIPVNPNNTNVASTTTLTLTGTFSDGFKNTNGAHQAPPTLSSGAVLSSVPEPTGVLIGLLGLPCMGAVVFFARRRSSEMALVA